MKYERFCRICGEYFLGYFNETACSESCKAEQVRISRESYREKNRFARRLAKAEKSKLDQTLEECERLGITYAEYKEKQLIEETRVKL